MTWQLISGDCLDAMREMDEASVDAIVTDPPYGLGFMGKDWDSPGGTGDFPMRRTDAANTVNTGNSRQGGRQRTTVDWQRRQARDARSYQAWTETWAAEALRVLKPGGHLLSFGGTRTYHRLVCALEDAGFEIRDCLAWLYGSGFPKSLDVSKAIDKAAGAAREVVGVKQAGMGSGKTFGMLQAEGRNDLANHDVEVTAPATPDAERWQGWGTALKPAFEPIVLARKPLSGTVAQNVLEYGTGALNVDGTRIEGAFKSGWSQAPGKASGFSPGDPDGMDFSRPREQVPDNPAGRWPANVLLDSEAAAALDEQSGEGGLGRVDYARPSKAGGWYTNGPSQGGGYPDDAPGASRFFYTAKTSRAERENGVAQYGLIEERENVGVRYTTMAGDGRPEPEVKPVSRSNHHPTVKPVDLMQWLCRLITPPKGLILDPFTGSGSTGIAALREGFSFIGIEREPDYVEIARARIIGDAPMFNVEAEV